MLAAMLAAVLVPACLAATVEEDEEEYVLAEGDVVDGDLYAFAGTVTIAGLVQGDVVAMGAKVEVAATGIVDGDLLAAGQTVTIRGEVTDDVRAAAFSVQLEDGGTIGGDLVGVGFNVSVAEGSSVKEDMLAAGYQGIVDGSIGSDLEFAGVALEINGEVAGDVTANVGGSEDGKAPDMSFLPFASDVPETIDPGLTIASDAVIGGDLDYDSPTEATVPEGAVAGTTDFEQVVSEGEEPEEEKTTADRALEWIASLIRDYIALVIVGLLLVLIWPRLASALTALLAERPAPSLGWGCLTIVVVLALAVIIPFVTIMLAVFFGAITLGGLAKVVLALGAVTTVALTAGVYLLTWAGTIVVGRWTGSSLLGRLSPEAGSGRWLPLLVGLAIVAVLINLPYIGWLLGALIAITGLGVMILWLMNRRARPAPAPAYAVPDQPVI
jgi:cytoskeletal protein CcmA (bactofilin family)